MEKVFCHIFFYCKQLAMYGGKHTIQICVVLSLLFGAFSLTLPQSYAASSSPAPLPLISFWQSAQNFFQYVFTSASHSIVSLLLPDYAPSTHPQHIAHHANGTTIPHSVLSDSTVNTAGQTNSVASFALSNLPLTAVNLLHNSSFETNNNNQPREWHYQLDSTTGNTFLSAEGVRSGTLGLKFVGGGTGNFGISQPTVKTIPGRTYTLSLFVKATNVPPSTTLHLGFWDEYHNTSGKMKVASLPSTEDWTRYSFTVTTPGQLTDPTNEFPLIEVEGLTSGAVYFDDAQLEEGSIATNYNSQQAVNTIQGDGSVLFTSHGDIVPVTDGFGSIGSSTNKFSSLNLSNASIDSSGDLSLNGGFTANAASEIKGQLTLDSNLVMKSGTTFSLPSLAANGLLYANGSSTLTSLSPGTSGYFLQSNGPNAVPSWVSTIGSSSSNGVFQTLTVGSSGQFTVNSSGQLNIAYSGNTGASAGQGVFTIDNSNNNGNGISLVTNTGSGAVGNLINLAVNNRSFPVAGFHEDYYGTGNGFEITNNSNDASSNALAVTGNNINDSTLGIIGFELGKGTIKVTHNRPTGLNDNNASGLSIDLKGVGTAAQGVYVDSTETGGTTGNLLRLRNQSVDKFVVDYQGNISQGGYGYNTTYTKYGNTTNDQFFIGTNGSFRVQRAVGNSEAFRVQIAGDTQGRWRGTSDGSLQWGDGTNAQDVILQRSGVGLLTLQGGLTFNNTNASYDSDFKGTTDNNLLYINSSLNQVGIGTSNPLAPLDIEKNGLGNAALIVNQKGTADLLTASLSGTTKFLVDASGDTWVDGNLRTTQSTFNLVNTNPTTINFGGNATTLSIASTSGTTTINNNLTIGAVGGSTTFTKNGTTTGDQFFIGTNGSIRAQRATTNSEAIRVQINGDAQGRLRFTSDGSLQWGDGTNAQDTILQRTAASTLGLTGNLSVSGTTAFNGQTYTWPGSGQSNGYVLTTNGSGTLSWTASSGLGTNYWQLNSGVLSPATITNQLAIGQTTALANAGIDVEVNGLGNAVGVINQTGAGDIFTASLSGATKFIINKNGNVGIGTTAPSVPLEISKARSGSDTMLTLETSGNGQTNDQTNILFKLPGSVGTLRSAAEISAIDQNVNNTVPGILTFSTSTGTSNLFERLRIDNNGNIGINTTSALGVLDVRGTNGINTMSGTIPVASIAGQTSFASLVVDNSGPGDLFTASSSGTPEFVINKNGNVGVGTTLPTAVLDVVGNASESGNLTFRGGGAQQINLLNNSSLAIGTSVGGDSGITANRPAIYIDSSGNVSFGVNSTVTNALGLGVLGTASSPKYFLAAQNSNSVGSASYMGRWQSSSPSNFWGIGPATANNDNMLRIGNAVSQGNSQWSTTQNLTLVFGGQEGIGQGTNNSLLGTLDVRNVTGTLATASISGQTSFAALTVDNSGSGDLFAASSSGLNRFVITQNGNVGIGTTTPTELLQVAAGNIVLDNNQGYKIKDSGGTARQALFMTSGNNLQLLNSASSGQVQVGINNGSNTSALIFSTKNNLERMRIDQNGNVGINATSPVFKLDTIDTQNSTASAAITNLSTSDTSSTNVLSLNLGTATTGTNARFIQFYAGANTERNAIGVGRIQLNNGNVAYNTGGADFAEYFSKGTTPLDQGDIVTIDSNGQANLATQTTGAVGIVSQTAGFIGNAPHDENQEKEKVIVGLVGQLPVKVSTENGAINAGDFLMMSSHPGVAMKATNAGQMIGRALESFDGSRGSHGTIQVLISMTYGDPTHQIALNSNGDLTVNGKVTKTSPSSVQTQSNPIANTSGIIEQSNIILSDLQSQVASMASQLGKIDDLSKQLVDLKEAFSDQRLASSSGILSNDNAIISGTFNVLGRTVLSDLGVTGRINTGLLTINGLDTENGSSSATINTLSSPLMFQSLATAGVDFEHGKVAIDTNGNVVVNAALSAKKLNIDTSDATAAAIGEGIITKGTTSVDVPTTAVTSHSEIFITSKTKGSGTLYVTTKDPGKKFTVELDSPTDKDIQFSWWIVN